MYIDMYVCVYVCSRDIDIKAVITKTEMING